MKKPDISVIMPVYNNEKHIRATIDSILNQSFDNFEFIILDDNSSDKSLEIIQSYTDLRITYYKSKERIGLTNVLNIGLKLARGEFIAIIDCSCIALPQRLEKQFDFLTNNPVIGLCGTYLKANGHRADQILKFHADSEVLKCELLFGLQILHPSVMFRKSVLNQNNLSYNDFYENAADYHLWTRFLKYAKIANIDEPLITYNNFIAISNYIKSSRLIRLLELKSLGISPTGEDMRLHEKISCENYDENDVFLKDVESWFNRLIHANDRVKYYDTKALKNVFTKKYIHISRELAKKNAKILEHKERPSLLAEMNTLSKETMSYLIVTYAAKLRIYAAIKRIKDSLG